MLVAALATPSWRSTCAATAAPPSRSGPTPGADHDQRTLATDVRAVVDDLALGPVAILGHDMGAPVARAYASAHRTDTRALGYFEEPVLDVNLAQITQFRPPAGGAWQFHFNLVPDLPETLIAGRERDWLTYFYRRFSADPAPMEASLPEYLRTFTGTDNIRGALGVYRAVFDSIAQSAEDAREPLTLPVLALGGSASSGDGVASAMRQVARDVTGGTIPDCGHFLAEECPRALLAELRPFLARTSP